MSNRPSEAQLKLLQTYGALQASGRFYYVTIHPLSDEHQLLKRLGLRQSDCRICDLYWAVGRRLALVGLISSPTEKPSVTYWKKKNDQVPHRFVVSTQTAPLTTERVEAVLSWLASWFISGGNRKMIKVESPSRICSEDIAVGTRPQR